MKLAIIISLLSILNLKVLRKKSQKTKFPLSKEDILISAEYLKKLRTNCLSPTASKHMLMAYGCDTATMENCELKGYYLSGWRPKTVNKRCEVAQNDFRTACNVFEEGITGRKGKYCPKGFKSMTPLDEELAINKEYFTGDTLNSYSFHTERVVYFDYQNAWDPKPGYVFMIGMKSPCDYQPSYCSAYLDKQFGSNYCYYAIETELFYSKSAKGATSCQ